MARGSRIITIDRNKFINQDKGRPMDERKLEYLIAAVEETSFEKTAEIYLSQDAILPLK